MIHEFSTIILSIDGGQDPSMSSTRTADVRMSNYVSLNPILMLLFFFGSDKNKFLESGDIT